MAEDEIIKHTKKAMDVMNSKTHSFWEKVKEILIEVFIIVFAVSLSIWFHNRSEHQHEQEQTREFLLGLREDLLNDLNEIKNDKESYLLQSKIFYYIARSKMKEPLQFDSLKAGAGNLYTTTMLEPNNGRFEGFKSSGRMGSIEDVKLQNDIMDLYQENIPNLLGSENFYVAQQRKLGEYVEKNQKRITDTSSNILAILKSDEARNLCATLSNPAEILARYDICAQKMREIISEIEKLYHIQSK